MEDFVIATENKTLVTFKYVGRYLYLCKIGQHFVSLIQLQGALIR